MSKCFENGQKLRSIFWEEESTIKVGQGGCVDIRVVFENGQMAGVPWALVTFTGLPLYKYNLAKVDGVSYPEADAAQH